MYSHQNVAVLSVLPADGILADPYQLQLGKNHIVMARTTFQVHKGTDILSQNLETKQFNKKLGS